MINNNIIVLGNYICAHIYTYIHDIRTALYVAVINNIVKLGYNNYSFGFP